MGLERASFKHLSKLLVHFFLKKYGLERRGAVPAADAIPMPKCGSCGKLTVDAICRNVITPEQLFFFWLHSQDPFQMPIRRSWKAHLLVRAMLIVVSILLAFQGDGGFEGGASGRQPIFPLLLMSIFFLGFAQDGVPA